ncbi:DUF2510 domain-containing protein [Sphaerisporangium corydalis]|uniref:DUF2510 domain-containing protein n=1 Tax=Sphaerisporangium corydalis TaxID=1441875 RepID=A0ABV9ECI6_9ACTN|nr:DUF2510 domain-containing protein [Sphaerisporangium corydalis]
MTQTPAGWYPDPYGTPQLRWWDGTQWTDATHPLEGPAGQGAPVTTGQWAQPGTGPQGAGPQPPPGTGQNPQPGTGQNPQPGTGQNPQPGTGQNPQGTGPYPRPGTGANPQPGMGPYPQPGPPQPGTGPYAPPGTPQFGPPPGQQATAQFGQPVGPYGAPAQQQWGNQGGTAQFPVPEFGPQGPPPKKGSMLPWVIGGGAVVVLLVVALIIGISVMNRGTTPVADSTPDPTTSIEPSDPQITPPLETTPAPSPSDSTDFPAELPQPKGNVITDPRTGLSYAFPGGPWTVPKWSDLNGTGPADPNFPQWTGGYETTSQKNYDGQNHDWVGQVLTCRLPEAFDYAGPQDLRNSAGALLVNYEKLFYSPPHKRKIVKDAALDVSGKKAWILRFEMDFTAESKKNNWKFTKEEGFFLVVDQGAGARPSVMYASVPDNLDTKVIDRVVDSLKAS